MLLHKIGQRLQRGTVVNGGGGVVGVREEHHLGFGRNRCLECFRIELVAVFGLELDGHGHAAGNADVEEVIGIARGGNDDLVSWLDERQDGKEQTRVGAGGDEDVALGIDIEPVLTVELLGDLCLELGGADGGGVVRGGLAASRLRVSIFHKIGHGMVGHERVGPAHESDALAFELLIRGSNVGFFDA